MTDLHELYVDQYRDRPQHDLDAAKAGRTVVVERANWATDVIGAEDRMVAMVCHPAACHCVEYRDMDGQIVGREWVRSVGTSGEVPAHAASTPPTPND